jgi:nicotinamide mononucleotide adenylyltransferase
MGKKLLEEALAKQGLEIPVEKLEMGDVTSNINSIYIFEEELASQMPQISSPKIIVSSLAKPKAYETLAKELSRRD